MICGDSSNQELLLIAPTPYHTEKGSALRVDMMAKRYRDAGYSVDVLCYNRGTDPDIEGVTVRRAGIKRFTTDTAGPSATDFLNDLFILFGAAKLVVENDYNLIQGEDFEGISVVLMVSLLSNTALIYDLHNPLTENLRINNVSVPDFISRTVEKIVYSKVDKIISNWNQWEADIRNRFGVDYVETVHDDLPDTEHKIELPTEDYLVYVGNFKEYQGVDMLIRAFATISETVDVDLVLVGDPTPEIRDVAVELDIEDRVFFLGQQEIEIANYVIDNAMGSVIPRRSGTQPGTKLIHYAMHDPPILATDLECNRELQALGHTVFWANPTVESLSIGIQRLCEENNG